MWSWMVAELELCCRIFMLLCCGLFCCVSVFVSRFCTSIRHYALRFLHSSISAVQRWFDSLSFCYRCSTPIPSRVAFLSSAEYIFIWYIFNQLQSHISLLTNNIYDKQDQKRKHPSLYTGEKPEETSLQDLQHRLHNRAYKAPISQTPETRWKAI